MAVRSGLVVFVRGSLRVHAAALEDLWLRLQAGLLRSRIGWYRPQRQTAWLQLPEASARGSFTDLFGFGDPLVGAWNLELSEHGDGTSDQESEGLWLRFTDLAAVRDMERASSFRVLFPAETPTTTVAALGEWVINHLPLWWGAAGFVFYHRQGSNFAAHKQMAALAKRYWGVQIHDMTALQWDALRGMPGVNWLNLIGKDFASTRELDIEDLGATGPAGLAEAGVFHRAGPTGVALAAGPGPLRGDINTAEDLKIYRHVARLMKPLLLDEHTPLFGPFARAEVLAAWLGRFTDPQAWLECDVAD